MKPARIDELLSQLQEPNAKLRWDAARYLDGAPTMQFLVINALVTALDDPGSWTEYWDDQGFVVGAQQNYVAEAAAESLLSYGMQVLFPALAHIQAGATRAAQHLGFLVKSFSPEQLASLDAEFRQELQKVLHQTEPQGVLAIRYHKAAVEALEWVDNEAGDQVERRLRRLFHPDYKMQRQAAGELAQHPEAARQIAPVIADGILQQTIDGLAQNVACRSLATFGDVLDTERVLALALQLEQHECLSALPEIVSVLANHFDHAPDVIAKLLLTWVQIKHHEVQRDRHGVNMSHIAAAQGMARIIHRRMDLKSRMLALYRHGNRGERNLGRLAFGGAEGLFAEMRDELEQLLTQGSLDDQKLGASICADLGKAASPLFDLLHDNLKRALAERWGPFNELVDAIGEMGAVAAPVVPTLLARFAQASGRHDRFNVILALGSLGRVASAALEPLAELRERYREQGLATGDIDTAIQRIKRR